MRNKNKDAKLVMLEHSKAKVELYTKYLSTYLNILSRVPHIRQIHIYDLMCGEGVYLDNSEGSPIEALKRIKDHYFENKETCPKIKIWFNDKDKSEIEKDKLKIDRVKEKILTMFVPSNVDIEFSSEDFETIFPKVLSRIKNLYNEKALLFIDPYGYKKIAPEDLKSLLSHKHTEIILFLPISFMYRFSKKSLSEDEFPGGTSLKEFLSPLLSYSENNLIADSPLEFIDQLKKAFKNYLEENKVYVDTFTIERDKQNIYCLFFFTPKVLGFEKMLEAKWNLDEQQGKGFKLISNQTALFQETEVCDYSSELKSFISSSEYKTNSDLYIFGLEKGFLPKHTNEILRRFQDTNSNFKVFLLDGKIARKGAFYIKYENYGKKPRKVVKFRFTN